MVQSVHAMLEFLYDIDSLKESECYLIGPKVIAETLGIETNEEHWVDYINTNLSVCLF